MPPPRPPSGPGSTGRRAQMPAEHDDIHSTPRSMPARTVVRTSPFSSRWSRCLRDAIVSRRRAPRNDRRSAGQPARPASRRPATERPSGRSSAVSGGSPGLRTYPHGPRRIHTVRSPARAAGPMSLIKPITHVRDLDPAHAPTPRPACRRTPCSASPPHPNRPRWPSTSQDRFSSRRKPPGPRGLVTGDTNEVPRHPAASTSTPERRVQVVRRSGIPPVACPAGPGVPWRRSSPAGSTGTRRSSLPRGRSRTRIPPRTYAAAPRASRPRFRTPESRRSARHTDIEPDRPERRPPAGSASAHPRRGELLVERPDRRRIRPPGHRGTELLEPVENPIAYPA